MRAIRVTSWKFPNFNKEIAVWRTYFDWLWWKGPINLLHRPSIVIMKLKWKRILKQINNLPCHRIQDIHFIHSISGVSRNYFMYYVLWYSIVMIIPHSNPKLNSIMTKNEYNNCLLYVCLHMGFSEKRTAEGITNI